MIAPSSALPLPSASVELPPDDLAALGGAIRAVVGAVLGRAASSADVDDTTQTALERALAGRGTARGPLRPWALGVARHVALDARRRGAREAARRASSTGPHEAVDDVAPLVERLPGTAPLADERLDHARRAARLRDALATLPDGPRRVLELHHVEGLGYAELAARLGVPLGTVATWLARGRRALAEALADAPPPGERR